jgi:predicted transcriptional regulator
MTEIEAHQEADLIELSASIVAAYVANNSMPVSELGNLLLSVHAAVKGLGGNGTAVSAKDEVVKLTPAQIKKSITPDALISFEDGKAYKTLRRHLTIRGLTPEGYRAKWGLSSDYPMTAASYSAARSELARSFGLGQQRKGSENQPEGKVDQPDEANSQDHAKAKPKRVGRPRKAAAA